MADETNEAEKSEGSDKSKDATRIIRAHMLGSAAAGIIPVPLVDIGVLGAVQLRMLAKLAKLYEVDFSEQRANVIIGSLASAGVTWSAKSLLSLVPGVGRLLGGVGGLLLPPASTYALGRVFVRHFESGGTFLTFDPERAKEEYEEEVETGKRVVEQNFAGVQP